MTEITFETIPEHMPPGSAFPYRDSGVEIVKADGRPIGRVVQNTRKRPYPGDGPDGELVDIEGWRLEDLTGREVEWSSNWTAIECAAYRLAVPRKAEPAPDLLSAVLEGICRYPEIAPVLLDLMQAASPPKPRRAAE